MVNSPDSPTAVGIHGTPMPGRAEPASWALSRPQRVAVIGASFAGLFAAAAVAAAGGEVILVERDVLGNTPEPRPGVPQGRQPHVVLHRGVLAMQQLLPGVAEELQAAGAQRLDTGHLPWLSPYGWMPASDASYEVYSLSRPLLELLVRRRVLSLPGVTLRQGVRVEGLSRSGNDWEVHLVNAGRIRADAVIDASGRSSRLPYWLAGLGYPGPPTALIEARLGYASRRFRNNGGVALRTGVVMLATPELPRGALALPIEDGRWMVLENGYGDQRPGRDVASFERFLATLPDPALSRLVAALEPDGDVAVHRQTGNQRRRYGRRGAWPRGLLVVGDSLCAFNPIYGQGITVAACQAEVLQEAVNHLSNARSTRRWQRRITALTNFPWAVSTSEDLRYPSANGRQDLVQRLMSRWTDRMSRLAVGDDHACLQAFADTYHLMGSPSRMFGPRVAASVLRSLVGTLPEPAPRPAVLDGLAQDNVTT
jgi:2-polyprenyl-6-methoxyphenol hydroxylase-like FAD-dependent oxidoreductase